MKRLVALWLCATVWLSAGGQSRDWANTGRYAAANAALAVRPKVVFIGDSITEGWYSAHPSFFDANGFAARGISGQVTAQMLARFQCDVVALRPRAVVILAGTNDIARNNGPIDEERIADNIRSMAELARAHGMRVFLCSVLPAARYGWRPEVTDAPDRIDRLNRMLREYASQISSEYQAQVDFQQNRVMKLLTIVTTIFLPLSLIVGWYGMNFQGMPELSWAYGYPAVIAVSVLIAVCLVIYFKKKRWF